MLEDMVFEDSAPSEGGSSGRASSSATSSSVNPNCVICSQDTTGDPTVKTFGRRWVHGECNNARRCLDRIASKDDDMRQLLLKMRFEDPAKYLGIVLSLRSEPNGRTAEARLGARKFIQEMTATTEVRKKKSVLLLPHRQFVAWYVHNEMLSVEEAEAKWQEEAESPDIHKEYEGSVLHLAVKLPTEISGIESLAKKKRVTFESTLNDDAAQRAAINNLKSGGGGSIHDKSFQHLGNDALQEGAASSSAGAEGADGEGFLGMFGQSNMFDAESLRGAAGNSRRPMDMPSQAPFSVPLASPHPGRICLEKESDQSAAEEMRFDDGMGASSTGERPSKRQCSRTVLLSSPVVGRTPWR